MREKKYKEMARRSIVFFAGLFFSSLGVGFITKAKLGTSPVSSLPYVLSLKFSPSLGEFTILQSAVLILLQIAVLRGKFKGKDWLQLPIAVIFGYFIDFSMFLLRDMNPEAYAHQFGMLVMGCAILGVGVYLEMIADLVMLPAEALIKAISVTYRTDFGFTKVIFDVIVVGMSCALSYIYFLNIQGIQEGTVIAAVSVGLIAKIILRTLKRFSLFLIPYQDDGGYDTGSNGSLSNNMLKDPESDI